MATVTAMSGAVALSEPPEHLRRRMIAVVEKEPRRSRAANFIPWAVTAAMSIALLAIGLAGKRQIGDTTRLQRALSVLHDPATKDVAFGAPDRVSGRIFVNSGQAVVVFIGARLPGIETGKTFELWVLPANGKPVPVGVFQSQPDATAVFVQSAPVQNAAAIVVTVEPQGGSQQPTTAPIVQTKL